MSPDRVRAGGCERKGEPREKVSPHVFLGREQRQDPHLRVREQPAEIVSHTST